MEPVIVVSGDSHATPTPDDWPHYIDRKFHGFLPQLHEDNAKYTRVLSLFADFSPELLEVIDTDGAWAGGGYEGAWDLDTRLAEMDRDGIAAEIVFQGDPRVIPMFGNTVTVFPHDVAQAGARGYNRWLLDRFGAARHRILMIGESGSCIDMDETVAELHWLADNGFLGVIAPGNRALPGLPDLYDPHFEPFWATCADLGLAVAIHAGYGNEPGAFWKGVEAIKVRMESAGRTDLLDEIVNNSASFFSLDLRPRRAMWQMMLGGVFDRHPDLRLMMVEVRGDWLPGTLAHLDAVFERERELLPAQRMPSECWREHCLANLSFVHKAEVEMRHEIGVDTMLFGRDYPHAEGTWPNTFEWLNHAFYGVPESELRLVLGENAITRLRLDRARLGAIAARVGPSVEGLNGVVPAVEPARLENWDARGGYLKPAERVDRVVLDALLREDLVGLAM